jgi:hypothetical protein
MLLEQEAGEEYVFVKVLVLSIMVVVGLYWMYHTISKH